MIFGRLDVEILRAIRQRHGCERAKRTAREFARQGEAGFAGIQHETRDIDQSLHVRIAVCGFSDDRSAIGVTDQNDRATDAASDATLRSGLAAAIAT